MRVTIIPKMQLSPQQLRDAELRIFAPEHACDVGPRNFWKKADRHQHFAVFDGESEDFVGTVHCVITPPVVQDFTWWIDSRMRKKGYWRALADSLAVYLKRMHQITAVGFIIFGNQHHHASQKIAQRLREHFEKKGRPGGP